MAGATAAETRAAVGLEVGAKGAEVREVVARATAARVAAAA